MERFKQLMKGTSENSAQELTIAFEDFFNNAEALKEEALAIVVTDGSQVPLMKEAKEKLKQIAAIRIAANKTKNAMKRDYIDRNKKIQSIYNTIEGITKPLEAHLKNQVDFVKIQKEKQLDEVEMIRKSEVSAFVDFLPAGLSLRTMTEEDYAKTVSLAKLAKEQKEAEEKAKIEQEKKDKEEQERMRKENEKLKKEAEEQKKEEDKIRAENDKIKRENEALQKEKEETISVSSNTALDERSQLLELANKFMSPKLPEFKEVSSQILIKAVAAKLQMIGRYIKEEVEMSDKNGPF